MEVVPALLVYDWVPPNSSNKYVLCCRSKEAATKNCSEVPLGPAIICVALPVEISEFDFIYWVSLAKEK